MNLNSFHEKFIDYIIIGQPDSMSRMEFYHGDCSDCSPRKSELKFDVIETCLSWKPAEAFCEI
ncbi:hypothetical protein V1478_015174 [Vespula squamosa]|uniref:Uncharacterized protein n=1 Tax=Vespula squamosa TaxID=30214 RepID=A0ABD2A537_VESSQ